MKYKTSVVPQKFPPEVWNRPPPHEPSEPGVVTLSRAFTMLQSDNAILRRALLDIARIISRALEKQK